LQVISTFSALLPIIFYFVFFERNKGGRLWVVPLYTATSFFTDVVQGLSTANKGLTFLSATLYSFLEGILFVIFLIGHLRSKLLRRVTILLAILNLAYGLVSVISNQNFENDNFNLGFAAVEEASIIILCVFYYYEQLNNPEVTFIYELKEFWIITAFFSVTVSTLFLLISSSILGAEMSDYWLISQVATLIKYFLLIIALTRHPSPVLVKRSLN
jgi:hypothetical protein